MHVTSEYHHDMKRHENRRYIQEQVHHRKHFGYVDTLKKHINIQSIDSSDKENICVYCEPSTLLERHIFL